MVVTADGVATSPVVSTDVLGFGFSTATATGRGMMADATPISSSAQSIYPAMVRGEASVAPPASVLMPYFEPISTFDDAAVLGEDPLMASSLLGGESYLMAPSQCFGSPMLPPLVYRLREGERMGSSSSAVARSGLHARAPGSSINSFPLSSSSPNAASQGFRSLPLPAHALSRSHAVPTTATATNFNRSDAIDNSPTTAPTVASFNVLNSVSSPMFVNASSSSRNPYLNFPSPSVSVATFPIVADRRTTASRSLLLANDSVSGGVANGHHSSSILLPPPLPVLLDSLGSGGRVGCDYDGGAAPPLFLLPPPLPPCLCDDCSGEPSSADATTAACGAIGVTADAQTFYQIIPRFDFGFGGESPAVAVMGDHHDGNAVPPTVEPPQQLLSTVAAAKLCPPCDVLPRNVSCDRGETQTGATFLLGPGMGPLSATALAPLPTPFHQRQLQHHQDQLSRRASCASPSSSSPSFGRALVLCWEDLLQQWGDDTATDGGTVNLSEGLAVNTPTAPVGVCGDDSLWMLKAAENVRLYHQRQQCDEEDAGDGRNACLIAAALSSSPNALLSSPLPPRHTCVHPSSPFSPPTNALAVHQRDEHQESVIAPSSSITKPSSSSSLSASLTLPLTTSCSSHATACSVAAHSAAGDAVVGGDGSTRYSVSVARRSSFVDGRRSGLGGGSGNAEGCLCDAVVSDGVPVGGSITRNRAREKELMSSAERSRGTMAPIPRYDLHRHHVDDRSPAVGSPTATATTATPYCTTPSAPSVFTFTPLRSPFRSSCGKGRLPRMAVLSSPFCGDTPPPRPFEMFAKAAAAVGVSGYGVGGGSAPFSSFVSGGAGAAAAVPFLTLSPQERWKQEYHHRNYDSATGEEDDGFLPLRLAVAVSTTSARKDSSPFLLSTSSPSSWCADGLRVARKGSFSFIEASSTPPPSPPRVAIAAPPSQTVAGTMAVDGLLGAQPPLLCFVPAPEEEVGCDGGRRDGLPSSPSSSSPPLPIALSMPTRRVFAKPPMLLPLVAASPNSSSVWPPLGSTATHHSATAPSDSDNVGGGGEGHCGDRAKRGELPIVRRRPPPLGPCSSASSAAAAAAASLTNRELIFDQYEGSDCEEEAVCPPCAEGSTKRVDAEVETVIFVVSDGEDSDANDDGDDESVVAFVGRSSRRPPRSHGNGKVGCSHCVPHGARVEGNVPSLLVSSSSLTTPLSFHPFHSSLALPLTVPLPGSTHMGPSNNVDDDDDDNDVITSVRTLCFSLAQIGNGYDRGHNNETRTVSTSVLSAATTVDLCAASGSVAGYSEGTVSASMATPRWGAEGTHAPSVISEFYDNPCKCDAARRCAAAAAGGGRSVPFSSSSSPPSGLISLTSHVASPPGGGRDTCTKRRGRTFSGSFGSTSQSAAAVTGDRHTVIKVGALPLMITVVGGGEGEGEAPSF